MIPNRSSGESPKKGYFAHPFALIEDGAEIGNDTRVWAFAHVLDGVRIGAECNICDHTFIESGAVLGHRVTVKCGVYLWAGLSVEDEVFIGPNATFTNDLRPRSKGYSVEFLPTVLKHGCSIGANATILPGITIGRWAMVAAGAVVTKDVAPFSLVKGNPARHAGWVCCCGRRTPTRPAGDPVSCSCPDTQEPSA